MWLQYDIDMAKNNLIKSTQPLVASLQLCANFFLCKRSIALLIWEPVMKKFKTAYSR